MNFTGLLIPDPGICDITKNPIFDYYWGIELYPHLGPFVSLKILINSRFGLFLWQLIILMAWKANYELYIASYNRGEINWPMTATTLLLSIYLAKFYYWEDGYMQVIKMPIVFIYSETFLSIILFVLIVNQISNSNVSE